MITDVNRVRQRYSVTVGETVARYGRWIALKLGNGDLVSRGGYRVVSGAAVHHSQSDESAFVLLLCLALGNRSVKRRKVAVRLTTVQAIPAQRSAVNATCLPTSTSMSTPISRHRSSYRRDDPCAARAWRAAMTTITFSGRLRHRVSNIIWLMPEVAISDWQITAGLMISVVHVTYMLCTLAARS
jgi:hypothetical protein